mgnify:CR=1 FL=1
MLMPSLFGENLLDDFFDMPMRSYRTQRENLMTTDIKEKDGNYEISMNLPGFKKEDIHAELKDGYLTISASTQRNNDEKDENGKYIRKERYSGSCSRSFYVGDGIQETDIKAKFEDGVLKLDIPKVETKPAVEGKHYISIEG